MGAAREVEGGRLRIAKPGIPGSGGVQRNPVEGHRRAVDLERVGIGQFAVVRAAFTVPQLELHPIDARHRRKVAPRERRRLGHEHGRERIDELRALAFEHRSPRREGRAFRGKISGGIAQRGEGERHAQGSRFDGLQAGEPPRLPAAEMLHLRVQAGFNGEKL